MVSRKDEIRAMVAALMATVASTARASRKGNAATLSLLQLLVASERARPSELAATLDVHQSTISRQLQSLEEAGYLTLTANPEDGRSCFATLTAKGRKRFEELHAFGLSRFEGFVADWSQDEIHTLGTLLTKLEASKAKVVQREEAARGRDQRGRSWREKSDPSELP